MNVEFGTIQESNFKEVEKMEKFIKYFIDGFRGSVVVGVPNFNENNQYQDGVNLSNDFYIAKKVVLKRYEKSKVKTTRK